jgi:hypothetical protein
MRIDNTGKDSRPPIARDVRWAITAQFAKADRPAVLAALERCRPRRDVARVHRAILALSFRSVREVERLVEISKDAAH